MVFLPSSDYSVVFLCGYPIDKFLIEWVFARKDSVSMLCLKLHELLKSQGSRAASQIQIQRQLVEELILLFGQVRRQWVLLISLALSSLILGPFSKRFFCGLCHVYIAAYQYGRLDTVLEHCIEQSLLGKRVRSPKTRQYYHLESALHELEGHSLQTLIDARDLPMARSNQLH
jgi:hypothetical protein